MACEDLADLGSEAIGVNHSTAWNSNETGEPVSRIWERLASDGKHFEFSSRTFQYLFPHTFEESGGFTFFRKNIPAWPGSI